MRMSSTPTCSRSSGRDGTSSPISPTVEISGLNIEEGWPPPRDEGTSSKLKPSSKIRRPMSRSSDGPRQTGTPKKRRPRSGKTDMLPAKGRNRDMHYLRFGLPPLRRDTASALGEIWGYATRWEISPAGDACGRPCKPGRRVRGACAAQPSTIAAYCLDIERWSSAGDLGSRPVE
jgi:hypothetical protein